MINYNVVAHPSGKLRIQQNLNNVISFVNNGKNKYFKTLADAKYFIGGLMLNNQRKAQLKKRNSKLRVNL